jgi:hypothetical protein
MTITLGDIVDAWSVAHVGAWALLLLLLSLAYPLKARGVFWVALLTGFGWEVGEVYLRNLYHAQYGEPWINSWLSDPAFDIAGAYVGWWFASLVRTHAPEWLSKRLPPG